MPTVPVYERQVRENKIQPTGINPVATVDTFGGGSSLESVNQSTQKAGASLLQLADQEKKNADKMFSLAGDKDLGDYVTKALYDPQNGALTKRGSASFDLPTTVMNDFIKKSEDVLKTANNESQRSQLREYIRSRSLDLDRQLQAHVAGEKKKYDDSLTESYLANEQEAASLSYNDPDRIQTSIERQQKTIFDYAQRNGLPDEYTKQKTQEMLSKTHESVILRMLANDEDLKAKGYYDGIKDTVKISIGTEKALEEGSLRGESQRIVDDITSKGLTRTQAYEEAKKIADPHLREATETRINAVYDRRKEAEAEARNQLYQQAATFVEGHMGENPRFSIPPNVWANLTLEQRTALERRSEDVPQNSKVWLDFLDVHQDDLASMSRSDFESKYWSNFDKEHRSRAETMWNNAIESKQKGIADPKLSTTLSFNSRIENTLRNADLIPKNKERSKLSRTESEIYDKFETEAAREIENYELTTLGGKRKVSGDEMQKIIDGMVIKKVFVDKSWSRDPQKPVGILNADEKDRVYVPIEDIPKDEITSIENIARSKNKRITKDKVQRAYAAMLTNNRPLFDAILAE